MYTTCNQHTNQDLERFSQPRKYLHSSYQHHFQVPTILKLFLFLKQSSRPHIHFIPKDTVFNSALPKVYMGQDILSAYLFPFMLNQPGLALVIRLPRYFSGKESTCQCRRHMFHPWMGRILWRRIWQPTPVFAWKIPWTE